MEIQLSKEAKRKAKAIAQERIKNFLKKLEKNPNEPEDNYSKIYDRKIYEGEIIKVLDDYGERKNNVILQWEELKAKVRLEARDGFINLTKEKRYEVFVKRRSEAEKILQDAHLCSRDTKELREKEDVGLVDTITKFYKIYGLHERKTRKMMKLKK